MNLGTLTATVDAETRGFVQGMAAAAARMQSFAMEVKKLAREVAHMGMGLVAVAGSALHMASTVDSGVRASLEGLKNSMLTLAVQVAHMVQPALQELTHILRDLADWFAGLSPAMRAHIAHWTLLAVEAAGVALAVGRVFGIISQLAGAFSALAGVIGSIGLGTLIVGIVAVTLAIAAVLAIIIALRKAWTENWGHMRETVSNFLSGFQTGWGDLVQTLITAWQEFVKLFTDQIRTMASMLGGLLRALGMDVAADFLDTIKTGADWVDYIFTPEGMASLKADALKAGHTVKEFFAEGLKGIASDLGLDKLFSINGHAQQYQEQKESIAGQKLGEVGEQGRMSEFYENQSTESLTRHGKLGEDDEQGHMTAAAAQTYQAEIDERQRFVEHLQTLNNAAKFGAQLFLSKLGELGTVINSAIQGFQTGGVWGAVFAVIMEMLSRFKRWSEIMNVANGQLDMFLNDTKGGLGSLVDGLKQAMGGIGVIAHAIHGILDPIMKIVGKALEHLGGLFAFIGVILEPIGAILNTLVGVFDDLGPVFKILGEVMRYVAIVILYITKGSMEVWNGIMDALNSLLSWLVGDFFKGLKVDETGISQQIADLMSGKSLDSMAAASANAAEGLGKLHDAAATTAEQLLNVPQGFKIALARFNATLATSSTTGINKNDIERQNFLQTGNPTTSGGGSSSPSSGSSGSGSSQPNSAHDNGDPHHHHGD